MAVAVQAVAEVAGEEAPLVLGNIQVEDSPMIVPMLRKPRSLTDM